MLFSCTSKGNDVMNSGDINDIATLCDTIYIATAHDVMTLESAEREHKIKIKSTFL